MPAEVLVRLYRQLTRDGIKIWIDGGWGVDALLGEQTRPHQDVDFVVQERDLARLVDVLRHKGYDEIATDDRRPWNFVLGDDRGRQVDIHVVNFDESGDGIYGPPENGEAYPASAFTGRGTIRGEEVFCMSVGYQLTNHAGYELQDKDRQDVSKLRDLLSPRGESKLPLRN